MEEFYSSNEDVKPTAVQEYWNADGKQEDTLQISNMISDTYTKMLKIVRSEICV